MPARSQVSNRAGARMTAVLLAALLGALACNATSAQTTSSQHDMSSIKELREWMKLRDLSQDELQKKLGVTAEHIATDRSYGNLTGVTQWRHPGAHPGYFIFKDGKLALIYVDDAKAVSKLEPGDLRQAFGEPEARLRSRAGKKAPFHVHAGQGLAYAADSDTVYYVEIFPPMSLADYQAKIYKEPPPYRK
jgi:transcriptional regulator with XRE-family HTH domain